MTKKEHSRYAFQDYLLTKPKMSRNEAEFEWHKEKQSRDKHTYDPDESKIDFQGLSFDEWLRTQNES